MRRVRTGSDAVRREAEELARLVQQTAAAAPPPRRPAPPAPEGLADVVRNHPVPCALAAIGLGTLLAWALRR